MRRRCDARATATALTARIPLSTQGDNVRRLYIQRGVAERLRAGLHPHMWHRNNTAPVALFPLSLLREFADPHTL